jgi:hypothetical protein
MKTILRVVFLAAFIALGVWLWFVLFPSPEEVIRKQLVKLAHDVSFSPDESNLAKLAGAQSLAGFFSTNVEVNINVPEHEQHALVGRDEITQAVLASRSSVNGLTVKFPDVNVTVAPDKQSATADVTFEATVSGERDAIVQEIKITFEKSEGKWLIKKVETVRTLSLCHPAPALDCASPLALSGCSSA